MKKRRLCALCAALTLLCACSRSAPGPAPGTTAPESTSSAAELVTGLKEDETETNGNKTVGADSVRRVFYGANTGTDRTLTGLEPLEPAELSIAAMRKGLSTETIDHSFGVAENERPHRISVEAQQRFDEEGLDAVVYDSRAAEKTLYLTFDCGYDNGQTGKILDTLKEKNVTAAFFCTLPELQATQELTARMIEEGHIVGNHSVTHPDFSALTHEQMRDEVKGFDDYLRQNFGYSAQFFRFPMGKYSMDAVAALNAMGYRCVFWSLAYYDWDLDKQPGVDNAIDTVVSRLHPGAVILLHAVSPDNAAALPRIIDKAREMGYTFRALNER
ncbi:MAG: polysaccharide deacetylase family protein [Clostridia bacterium]|nr:polysaccharide deacetylase family protein [Clostridia bacterium]